MGCFAFARINHLQFSFPLLLNGKGNFHHSVLNRKRGVNLEEVYNFPTDFPQNYCNSSI